jgi:nitrogen regulatory protein PII
MKKIESIIKPDRFSYVKVALVTAGYTSLTAYNVERTGQTNRNNRTSQWKKDTGRYPA